MAKKTKKRSTSTTAEAVSHVNAATPKTTALRASSAEFNPDYSYVKKDLRRIGMLAGSFFIILAVLAFFLR